MRQKVFDHIKKKYKAAPEYPWKKYPEYAVFRHADNKKWFALVMDVAGDKLGLPSTDHVDCINLKIDDLFFRDLSPLNQKFTDRLSGLPVFFPKLVHLSLSQKPFFFQVF